MKKILNYSPLIITQKFSKIHGGIDIRSWDFEKGTLIPVTSPDGLVVLRQHIDGYGNDVLVARGKISKKIIMFCHVNFSTEYLQDDFIEPLTVLGTTQIKQEVGRGNSLAHHLHFSVRSVDGGEWENPEDYLKMMGVEYRYV